MSSSSACATGSRVPLRASVRRVPSHTAREFSADSADVLSSCRRTSRGARLFSATNDRRSSTRVHLTMEALTPHSHPGTVSSCAMRSGVGGFRPGIPRRSCLCSLDHAFNRLSRASDEDAEGRWPCFKKNSPKSRTFASHAFPIGSQLKPESASNRAICSSARCRLLWSCRKFANRSSRGFTLSAPSRALRRGNSPVAAAKRSRSSICSFQSSLTKFPPKFDHPVPLIRHGFYPFRTTKVSQGHAPEPQTTRWRRASASSRSTLIPPAPSPISADRSLLEHHLLCGRIK
jgi:hypothetical protein